MRKLLSAAFGLASVILLSSPAVASEAEEKELKKGWYFHVGVGTTVLFGSDVDLKVDGNEYSGSLSNDWGGAVEGGVGYDFGEWSADLIYKYRWFDNEDFNFNGNHFGASLANVSVGNSDWQTLLLGIYKDFQDPDSKFFFKLGPVAGVGCFNSPDVTAKYTFVRADSTLSRKVKVKSKGSNDCSFTWGGKAGVGYEINPNWDVTFDVMWVSQTGASTTSGGKKKRVSYSITEPVQVARTTTANVFNGALDNGFGTNCALAQTLGLPIANCFQATTTTATVTENRTTTYIKDINVKSLRYSPAQGLNLMLGLRYTFGSKPKPAPEVVIEEAVIEEEVIETPVRGLW